MGPMESMQPERGATPPETRAGRELPPQLTRVEPEYNPDAGRKELQKKLKDAVYAAFIAQKVLIETSELESILAEVGFPDDQTISILSTELEKRRNLQIKKPRKD